MKFRKKPVVIEAEQVHPSGIEGEPPLRWLGRWIEDLEPIEGAQVIGSPLSEMVFAPDHVLISTLEGVMRADLGDYIIRGVNGEFYPCKPDIFEKTYEAV